MSVAELMREWRRLTGLNTAAAGEELGVSSRTIEDIEQGRTRVDDVLTRYGLEALIAQAKLHSGHDRQQREAALVAVAERPKKVGKRRK
mgnify:CR=1 FL=1